MKSRALNLAVLALLVSFCGWSATFVRSAGAQALDAGKPPSQIFAGTCAACHRSPRGLVRNVGPGSLPGFLRQHYTTGNNMAGVMAAYVLGSGGTDRVAEPPKREPRQKAKSDQTEVAARHPEQKELSKSARQRAAKKGPPEPPPAAKETPVPSEPQKADTPPAEAPPPEPPKAETAAAVDCKVEEPAKQTTASTDEGHVASATPAAPPRQPTSLLTLPGFPAPEPEPEPVATAAAPPAPSPASGCDPANSAAAAAPAAASAEAVSDQPPEKAPAVAPPTPTPAMAEAPNSEPLRPTVTEPAIPSIDIMKEEVHVPRPGRSARSGQKKRVQ